MVENEPPPGAVKRGQARCGPLSGRICAIALQAIRRYRFRRDRHHLVSFLYYVSICIVIHDTTKYITSPHFLSKVQHPVLIAVRVGYQTGPSNPPLPHGRRRPRNKYGEARRRRHGVSGMPVTNTPTCSSRIDPHRVESDSSDFFRGRGPAGRNPTASIARWREGKLPHSVDLNAQRYWMAPNISQDRPPPAFAGCWPIRTGST